MFWKKKQIGGFENCSRWAGASTGSNAHLEYPDTPSVGGGIAARSRTANARRIFEMSSPATGAATKSASESFTGGRGALNISFAGLIATAHFMRGGGRIRSVSGAARRERTHTNCSHEDFAPSATRNFASSDLMGLLSRPTNC